MPNTSSNDEPASKRGKVDRKICSMCKVAKSLDGFSKNQRSKGDDAAKCTECISKMQQSVDQKQQAKTLERQRAIEDMKKKRQEERTRADEARKQLEAEKKMMENLDERPCARCHITKKKEGFDDDQRKRGKKSVCKDCTDDLQAEALEKRRRVEERRKRREAEERKIILEDNEKDEAHLYKQKKDVYEQYIKKLEENGSSIEKEMTTPSDLLYIVTSISGRGDQFSPHLHGVYTTCQKAQEGARTAFEKVSESYRDGKFIPNDERVSKCDVTDFLIPGISFTSRPMFELFGDDEDADCTAIAINSVHVDTDVKQDLPFLRSHRVEGEPEVREKSAAAPIDQGAKVYAIFSYWPGGMGGDYDVTLCGIYRNREDAMDRAHKFTKFNDDEEEKDQIEAASGVSNGKLFVDMEDCCWAVAMETVILDKEHGGDYGKELDIGCMGSSAWMHPQIEWY